MIIAKRRATLSLTKPTVQTINSLIKRITIYRSSCKLDTQYLVPLSDVVTRVTRDDSRVGSGLYWASRSGRTGIKFCTVFHIESGKSDEISPKRTLVRA